VQTPVKSSIAFTEGKLETAEKILKQYPRSTTSSQQSADSPPTRGGGRAVTDGQVNSGLIYVTLKRSHSAPWASSNLWTNCAGTQRDPDVSVVPQDLASHDFIAGRGFPSS